MSGYATVGPLCFGTALVSMVIIVALAILYLVRRKKLTWLHRESELGNGWPPEYLTQRVVAAEKLGYDTVLKVSNGDLLVFYVKKAPSRPMNV